MALFMILKAEVYTILNKTKLFEQQCRKKQLSKKFDLIPSCPWMFYSSLSCLLCHQSEETRMVFAVEVSVWKQKKKKSTRTTKKSVGFATRFEKACDQTKLRRHWWHTSDKVIHASAHFFRSELLSDFDACLWAQVSNLTTSFRSLYGKTRDWK